MDRSLIGHLVLVAVTTSMAYAAWSQPARSTGEEKVVAVPGSTDRLTEVTWEETNSAVTMRREGAGLVVSVANKKGRGGEELAQPEVRTYPGTDKAKEVFDAMAPLQATRALGVPEAAKLASLGLSPAASTLVLRFGGQERRVAFGNATFGSGSYYAQPDGGEVYLMPSSTVASLRNGATQLIDRNIVGAARDTIERVVLTAGAGRRREVLQRNAEDRASAYFADPAEPDTKLEKTTAWLDRLMRLRLLDMVSEAPQGEPALTIELWGKRDKIDELALWLGDDKNAFVKAKRFDQTLTIAKNTAEGLLNDVDAVLSENEQ